MLVRELRLQAEQMEDGETFRGDCPSCGRPKTFTLTREEGGKCVFNCFSTHCNFVGSFGGVRNLVRTRLKEEPRKQRIRPFTGELRELNEEQKAFLANRIGFTDEHVGRCGVMYCPVDDRYAYPIYAPTGRRRGWVLRAYDGHDPRWKALTRLDVEEPHLSWYGAGRNNRVLVVEDIPSAVRASFVLGDEASCVAMCGGGIGPDYVRELTAYAKHVAWAFDSDATNTAISHHRRYGICFESSRVVVLRNDLKDCRDDQISDVLKGIW